MTLPRAGPSSLRALSPFVSVILVVLIVGLWLGAPVFAQAATSVATASSQTTGVASASLGPSSDGVNAVIAISGSGFLPARNVTATFGAYALSLTGTCTTTSAGGITGCEFRVPDKGPGTYPVSVTDGTNVAAVSFTIPSVSIPESTFLVTLTSVGLGLVTQLATRRLVDLNAERRMKAEVAAFNKEKREATLAKDKARLEKLKKRELAMRQAQAKVSTARLKVTAVTFVPLLAVYYLMANFLGGFNVAVAYSPIPIPLLVGPNGTMVLFWWYLLSSFTFSTLLTKLMHTTT